MTLQELAGKDVLTNTELKRFGGRVKIFRFDDYHNREAVQIAVKEEMERYPSEVFTGHHTEYDWSQTHYWQRGWHLFNRTLDYAVVRDSCDICVYHKSFGGDLVRWCKSFAITATPETALAVSET